MTFFSLSRTVKYSAPLLF